MGASPEDFGFISPERCELQRRVLRDDALQAEFDELGYVVVPFLSVAEVATLVQGYAAVADSEVGVNAPGAYNDQFAEFSIIHSRPAFRRDAFELISSVLVPRADKVLADYRPLIANYVNKPPGTGVVPAHQNFSVVDESRYQSVSVWVALVDTVVGNGAMSMLDGSHRLLRGRRGMWAYRAFGAIEETMVDSYLTPVEVSAGQAVILDDALVHYSPPNLSDARRLAIQFVMVPDEAEALWFQQVGGDEEHLEVAVWQVEEPFFFEFWHGDGDERHATRRGTIEMPSAELDAATFCALLDLPAPPQADEPEQEAQDGPEEPGEQGSNADRPSSDAAPHVASMPDQSPAAPRRGLRSLLRRR